jgi:hypothetical protein
VFPEQCALIQCPSGRRSARSADDASSNAVSRERASVRSAGGQTVEVDWRIEARLSGVIRKTHLEEEPRVISTDSARDSVGYEKSKI